MSFAPCFIAGVIAYRLSRGPRLQLPSLGWPLLLLATSLAYQFHWGAKTGWVLCLLVGVAVPQFRELGPGLIQKTCQLVARYSYGIYLTHLICIWLAFDVLSSLPRYAQWLVFAGSSAALPVALYHAIEAPMIAVGARLAGRWAQRSPAALAASAAE